MHPVKVAAKKPARDFLGANLMNGTRGRWEGKGGVYLPHSLPIVEAVVSDHERLNVSFHLPREEYAHVKTDTTAISRGYTIRTNITPIR
jgi:hypothetical protein